MLKRNEEYQEVDCVARDARRGGGDRARMGYCASWSVKLHDENQTREGGDACGWSGRITRETKKMVNVVFRLYTFASQ